VKFHTSARGFVFLSYEPERQKFARRQRNIMFTVAGGEKELRNMPKTTVIPQVRV